MSRVDAFSVVSGIVGPFRASPGATEVAFTADGGRRCAAYQAHLLREAACGYGSADEAARWVATPEAPRYVCGDAVDGGPSHGPGIRS